MTESTANRIRKPNEKEIYMPVLKKITMKVEGAVARVW